jgi:hypothetical protein
MRRQRDMPQQVRVYWQVVLQRGVVHRGVREMHEICAGFV